MRNNKFLITVIFLSLLYTIASLVYPFLGERVGISVFIIASYYLMFVNGTFIRSPYYRYSSIAISILLIGVIFKLMHWPYADLILSAGIAGVAILYTIHFIVKKRKGLLDYGKVLLLLTDISLRYCKLMHVAKIDSANNIFHYVFILFVIYYIIKKHASDIPFRTK